jgi:hypothetical protein
MSRSNNFGIQSTLDIQKVKKIQFGLLDPKEIVSSLVLFHF